ncbi:imm11 family protein [Altererythrobacter sp.]|uniref:imm11 family protein n=1 Tax=Altererythrobacter sp. TaxID=1872480 RepID=UPI003D063832
MVWVMSYRPVPDSYPGVEVIEGNSGELELEDMTDDGGIGLKMSRSFSGRRAKPESVPKVIRWKSKRKLLDYENACRKTVSDRFRALIEEIEPGVHQFEPIRFVAKDGSLLEERWFWQICNRINSVHPELSNWLLGPRTWRPPPKPRSEGLRMVFDTTAIGGAQFWHDMHIKGTLVSDAAKQRIDAAGTTGVHFDYREQA